MAAVAAFAPPRRAALLGTIAVASRIGYRFGIFGGFRAAALLRARPALLGATLPSTTASAPRLSLRFGNFGGFPAAALCRARLASLGKVPRSAPRGFWPMRTDLMITKVPRSAPRGFWPMRTDPMITAIALCAAL